MNEEINAWINSDQDYNTGMALYMKYGTSRSLLRILTVGGPSKKNAASLLYELTKLMRTTTVKIVRPAAAPQKPKKPTFVQKVEVTGRRENTPEVDALREEIVGLLKVRDSLQSSLEHLSSDKKRKEAAFKILDISEQVQKNYERLAHFDKHGVLPPLPVKEEEKKNSDLDREELVKKQFVIRTYVSRYKGYVKNSKDPLKKASNETYLKKYQAELAEIEKLLKK